jgi:hypothetical protein
MDLKRFLFAVILFTVVAQIIHTLGAILTMGYYMDPAYFDVWSRIMMPTAGPPPVKFFFLSIDLGLISSIIYVYAYVRLNKSIPGKGWIRNGLNFGALLFLLGVLPGMLSLVLLINLPLLLVLEWIGEGLIVMLIGGMITARLMGGMESPKVEEKKAASKKQKKKNNN